MIPAGYVKFPYFPPDQSLNLNISNEAINLFFTMFPPQQYKIMVYWFVFSTTISHNM